MLAHFIADTACDKRSVTRFELFPGLQFKTKLFELCAIVKEDEMGGHGHQPFEASFVVQLLQCKDYCSCFLV